MWTGWMPAHAWHAIIVRSGQLCRRAHERLETCTRLRATSAHRAPSGAYAARACQLLHRLCNIVCLFLASIGTQTDAAVMTDNRIGLP